MLSILRVIAVSIFLILSGLFIGVADLFQATPTEDTDASSKQQKNSVVVETIDRVRERVSDTADTLREAGRIITSEPLRIFESSSQSHLTIDGIVNETNMARQNNGVPPLVLNDQLSQAATFKAQDMLVKQYFAHESPTGAGPSDVITDTGYEYIVVGENLAMGLFHDDAALVEAWMNSPGHRENILKPEFREIGIGIVRGEYQGDDVWFAVQEFGRPISDCPQVDKHLALEIEETQTRLDSEQQYLESLRDKISSYKRNSQEYRNTVDEYNKRVEIYNKDVQSIKTLINTYNISVQEFNTCAGVE